MKADRSTGSILRFFLLAVVLIVPFWVIGGVTGLQVLPGLPLAGLGTFCPAAAAGIVVHQECGGAGVVALLRRSIHLEAKIWLAPTLLLMPVVSAVSFAVLRLSGVLVPVPQAGLTYALILCAASFIGALGEELGWSGYAIDPMQARWGALRASIVMGSIWALYHYVGLVQAHRALMWIAGWTLGTLALRVIVVWLYNNSGRSVLVAALFHMTINVTWQLCPVDGSYYDPGVTGLILAVVAAIAVAGWGPRTLARSAGPSQARRQKERGGRHGRNHLSIVDLHQELTSGAASQVVQQSSTEGGGRAGVGS